MSTSMRDHVQRLHALGWTLDQITSELGCTRSTAYKWVLVLRETETAEREAKVKAMSVEEKVDECGRLFDAGRNVDEIATMMKVCRSSALEYLRRYRHGVGDVKTIICHVCGVKVGKNRAVVLNSHRHCQPCNTRAMRDHCMETRRKLGMMV